MAVAAPCPWLVADAAGADRRDRVGGVDDRPPSSRSSMGRVLHRQRRLIEQLEAAREALAEQAVAEERRRIARELHDLAGHTLAAVLLHVTGARHVLRRDVDEAERALVDAETVGRASLDQIRATVAALRTDERGTDPALAGSADLAALVDEYRRAGLAIEADVAPAAARPRGPDGHGPAPHRPGGARQRGPPRARQRRRSLTVAAATRTGCACAWSTTAGRRPARPPAPGHFGHRRHARAGPGPRRPARRRARPPTAGGSRPGCRRSPATARRRGAVVIRVLIVDDQPVVRAGVARILGPDDGFEVVAECDDGDEVVDAVAAHQPDVVLMDVRMRRVDGVTATAAPASARATTPPVLVLTTFDDDDVLWGALDAGAAGLRAQGRLGRGPDRRRPGGGRRRGLARSRRWRRGCSHAARGARRAPRRRGRAGRRADRAGARRAAPHGPGRHQRRDRRRRSSWARPR